jgi:hypothetical protein
MEHIVIRTGASFTYFINCYIHLEKSEVETVKPPATGNPFLDSDGKTWTARSRTEKFAEAKLHGLKSVMEGNLNAIYAGEEKSLELREKNFRLNPQSIGEVYSFPRTIHQSPIKRAP